MDPFEAPPPASALSRFYDTSAKLQRYRILLRRRWWVLLLTGAATVCFQAWMIFWKPVEFMAVGRIHAGITFSVPSAQGGGQNVVSENVRADFYGTQQEILESAALQTRALNRMGTVHPELRAIPVKIRVNQTKGSAILNVVATGEEPKYTYLYLNELLDEYMAFRRDMMEKGVNSALNKIISEVLSREKTLNKKRQDLDEYTRSNDILVTEASRSQSAQYLRQLENTLNQFETENKLMTILEMEDYLRQKERAGSAVPSSLPRNEKMPAPEGGVVSLPEGANSPGGGLARSETDYLKAIQDLKVLEAQRRADLQTYKPAHEIVQEVDRRIEKQRDLINIYKQQSGEEWNRRKAEVAQRIKALQEEIKDYKNRARDDNEKIVTFQQKERDYKRADEDYLTWRRMMESLEQYDPLGGGGNISIMDRPGSAHEVQPDIWLPLALYLVAGIAIGAVGLLLFDRLDDRMNSFSEFQALFPSEPILGQIPELSIRGDVSLIRPNDERPLYAEAFRNLRSSILFKNWKEGKPPKLILVTSAVPNEGKTTTVANLAVTLALGGSRVLLVDADLRRGGINELFKIEVSPGFSEVLNSKASWKDARKDTGTKGLQVLPRGEPLENASELFLNTLSQDVLKEMGEEYDYVIFDSAPVLVADDTASFAPQLDTTLFIVRMSSTMARLTAKALDVLFDRQVNVGGVILNRSSSNLKEYTYYNYASYYSVNGGKGKDEAPKA